MFVTETSSPNRVGKWYSKSSILTIPNFLRAFSCIGKIRKIFVSLSSKFMASSYFKYLPFRCGAGDEADLRMRDFEMFSKKFRNRFICPTCYGTLFHRYDIAILRVWYEFKWRGGHLIFFLSGLGLHKNFHSLSL